MSSPEPNDLNLEKSEWVLTRLGDLASDVNERVANPAESEHDRFVGLEHFVSGDLKIKDWKATDGLVSAAKAFRTGDILFARRNAYLKRASMVDFDGVCSGDAFVLREDHDKVVPGYLAFVMNSRALWRHAISNAAGTMSKRVKWRDLANYEFHLPPKDQQVKLAELLWAADGASQHRKQLANGLEMLTSRVKTMAFIQGNGAEETKPFFSHRIPKHWAIRPISDIANVEYGISKSVAQNKDPNIGWPILTGANITLSGQINLEKRVYIEPPTKDRFFLEKGDLLFNWRSGSPEHVGKTARFELDEDFTYASFILRIRCGEHADRGYMYHLLNFLRSIEFFTREMAQQVNFKMNATVFRGVEIPVPPVEEQKAIGEELNRLHAHKREIDEAISVSRALQQSLINQIF